MSEEVAKEKKVKKGIGGWLILPAIGVALNPLLTLISLVNGVSLLDSRAAGMYPAIKTYAGLVILGGLFFLVFSIVLAVQFFRKKARAKRTFIWYLVSVAVFRFLILLVVMGGGTFPDELVLGAFADFAIWFLPMMIWIPYFLRSKRVKNTFVN